MKKENKMTISNFKNHFFEALKQEFGLKEIVVDNLSFNVKPVKYNGLYGDKIEYPKAIEWTFDGKMWWKYVPRPIFKQKVNTLGFFSHHTTIVEYDPDELINVIKLSKTCKNSDELNMILHGRSKPPVFIDEFVNVY